MFRRIATVVATFGVSLVLLAPARAQTVPTSPATIDVTCHGYDEGATRAYNCIPVASQQHLLATFVPPVGSACNGGQVAEFPPGRIVFQIRCQDGEGGTTTPTPQPTAADYEIANVRRYLTTIDDADWLEFTWRARVSARKFEVTVKFQQGAFFSSCTETWYNPEAGEQDTETSIPSVCGTDDQWSSVTIQPADGRTCQGCGTFARSSLPTTDSLSLTSADPAEVPVFIEEATLAAQIGAADR